jgi:hypothetical protein
MSSVSKSTLLYINHGLGTRCGVHAYGRRHFRVISESSNFTAVYRECNSLAEFWACHDEVAPDVVFVNYMPVVMPWLVPTSPRPLTPMVVVQHFFDQGSASNALSGYGGLFDYMVCLDPSLVPDNPKVFAHARPVLRAKVDRNSLSDPIRIGSFGFALPHKQFHIVVQEANRCFDSALVNLHLTVGDFTGDYVSSVLGDCLAQVTKPGIDVHHSWDYLSDEAMISRLSENHINALFYDFPAGSAGLSSAIDYLISAQRPVLITDCTLFRHVRNQFPLFPAVTFSDIADDYDRYQEDAFNTYVAHSTQLLFDTEATLEKIL